MKKNFILILFVASFLAAVHAYEDVRIEEIKVTTNNFTFKNATDKLFACYDDIPFLKKSFTSLDSVELYRKESKGLKSYQAYFYLKSMRDKGPFFISFNSKGEISCLGIKLNPNPIGERIIKEEFEKSSWVGWYFDDLWGCWWSKKKINEDSIIKKIDHYRYDELEDTNMSAKLKFYFYNSKNTSKLDGTATLSADKDAKIDCEISDG